MKKLCLSVVSIFILFSMYPRYIHADDLDVGITINNPVIIDVETTLSTNIVVDVDNKQSIPSYVHIVNNGNSFINVSITDITATGVDSPSTFVSYSTTEPTTGKTWLDLDQTETKEYIAFGISSGENETYQSILPDTPLSLGTVKYYDPEMGTSTMNNNESTKSMSYSLIAKTGFNWGVTNSLAYKLTLVTEVAETYTHPNPSKHQGISGNVNIAGILNANDLTLVANFVATSEYVAPNASSVMMGAKIVSPSGDYREYPPTPVDNITPETIDDTTSYEISSDIADYTFSETGIYYIVVSFGFADGEGNFSPSSNYSQVISFTR